MHRILLAIRAFFAALFSAAAARRIEAALRAPAPAAEEVGRPAAKKPAKPRPPVRSDALTLLSALQREARFVDFVKESLEGYPDSQIGAVARDVHRDCGKLLERLFALRPVVSDEEGAEVQVAAGFDAGCYRLTGNVAGQPPFRGRMTHHGWRATACKLPDWTGTEAAARVVAPVEVELRQ